MSYEFFFSYTRANNDAYLKQFFDDLCQGIRDLRGLKPTDDVGFFDQRDLELGEDWDASIVGALQSSKCVVAISSPAYFKSEYCGKEWELFRQRCAAGVLPGQAIPPLIKPVIWVPFKVEAMAPVTGVGQFTFGDPQAVQNTKGFKYLLKQLQVYRTEYNDLVDTLAHEIVAANNKHPLPALPNVPRLKDTIAAFPVAADVGVSTAVSAFGPKYVRFVYAAADPSQFGGAREHDPYLDVGGPDWKPFYPGDNTKLHKFVTKVLAEDEFDFIPNELPFGPNLIAEIDTAWQRRQIVILIIDGWSIYWSDSYRKLLSQLDSRLDYHWCALLPWNEQDPETISKRSEILRAVNNTFDRHANLVRNPMFYRDGIKSPDDLKSALREVLTRLKEEIKKRATVDMPVPTGPPIAVITGP